MVSSYRTRSDRLAHQIKLNTVIQKNHMQGSYTKNVKVLFIWTEL